VGLVGGDKGASRQASGLENVLFTSHEGSLCESLAQNRVAKPPFLLAREIAYSSGQCLREMPDSTREGIPLGLPWAWSPSIADRIRVLGRDGWRESEPIVSIESRPRGLSEPRLPAAGSAIGNRSIQFRMREKRVVPFPQ
jgi:hypothetical protein